MPINSVHPNYAALQEPWELIEDFYAGELTVKAAGEKHLPKGRLADSEFEAYTEEARFLAATRLAANTMSGLLLRSPAEFVNVGDRKRDLAKKQFAPLTRRGAKSALLKGRFAILIDAGKEERANASVVFYDGADIINWSPNGDWVILRENYMAPSSDDPYHQQLKTRFRELRLLRASEGADPVYQQSVWEQIDGTWAKRETITPRRGGQTLNYLPLYIYTSQNLFDCKDIPLLPIALLNRQHYRYGAAIGRIIRMSGHPQIVLTGWEFGEEATEEEREFRISDAVWHTNAPGARATVLQITTESIGPIQVQMDGLKSDMAASGANILTAVSGNNLAEETTKIFRDRETISLKMISADLSEVFTNAFREWLSWNGGSTAEITSGAIVFDDNYYPNAMSAEDIKARLELLMEGAMSIDTMLKSLEQGGAYPEGVTADSERGMLEAEGR